MEKLIREEITDILVFSSEKKAKLFTKILVALIPDIENGIIRDEKVFIKGMREINDCINRGLYGKKSKINSFITTSEGKRIALQPFCKQFNLNK